MNTMNTREHNPKISIEGGVKTRRLDNVLQCMLKMFGSSQIFSRAFVLV